MDILALVQTVLVVAAHPVDQAVYVRTGARNHVGVTALVDQPAMFQQHGPSNVLAVGASSCHLLQPEIAPIGKVQLVWWAGHGVCRVARNDQAIDSLEPGF